jgi:hypothetical protein
MDTPCYTYADVPGRAAWIILQDAEEELESALKTYPKGTAVALLHGRGYFIDEKGVLKAAPVNGESRLNYEEAKNRMEYTGLDWKTMREIAKDVRSWLALPADSRPIAAKQ